MSCSRGWWNDLPSDLLALVAGCLTFQAYTRARAACAARRAALPAISSPSLLVLHDDHRERSSFSAWFLSPRISIASLATNLISTGRAQRCVGSGHGWVAFGDFNASLVNAFTGDEIPFHSFPEKHGVVMSKVVFAPNPTPAEFTAAAITGHLRVTYTTRGNSGWTDVELPRLGAIGGGDYIADVVYHEKEFGGGKKKKVVYCLTGGGDVLVLRLPAGRRRRQRRPASFEPLFDKASAVFYPAAAFAPPHSTGDKYLVVCDDGHLYQIWMDEKISYGSGAIASVLRYYPRRRPCWLPAKDLGGRSFFVGVNNAVALRVDGGGGGASGLRGNCVYWSARCSSRAKVFDVESGKSATCFPVVDLETGKSAPGFPGGAEAHRALCWFFLADMRSSSSNTRVGTSAHQLQKRARHA
ncbi:uncharacterized protein [Oryza sativa Japonica Group]|uniref:KIB1-4 beta-propeller domain-containing protein n=2 Tax=Oryza sativa subsp. japonica TaxID=39947 RepID=A3BP90_ORYSJ|nr:hypothetical protein OsJ_25896 [Oryza sativa Japonica Group]KAF2917915.1 hypothetical protein DAI22_08g019000 [Oryza sativa Japonica Group]BAD08855.1 hypothetical protein [Oryza sativa Japonica Group]BAT03667.1 Os08g0126900 [Oryza sativa Japonica Group]